MIALRRRTPLVFVFACALTTMSASPAIAAPGDLDPTFGGDGKVITNFTSGRDLAADVAIQADGKVVAVGRSSGSGGFGKFALARYNSDGTLDTTFGPGGKVTTNLTDGEDHANGVTIQADGKIVAAGTASVSELDSSFALARYNSDGTLDTSFSRDGKVTTNFTTGFDGAAGVAIQADGNIVAAGGSGNGRFALARYNPDGTLDTTFGHGGKVTTRFTAESAGASGVGIQADGKIVAAGTASVSEFDNGFALARYNSDGTLDTTFGRSGKVTTNLTTGGDFALDVAIQADGKIVAAGDAGFCCEWTSDFGLVRYNPDGILDTSFSANGKVITEFTTHDDVASDVAIQADGMIVAVGSAGFAGEGSDTTFALARYNPDGILDTSFSDDGKVTTNFTAGFDGAAGVAIQADRKIVAAGGASVSETDLRFALARYLGG